MKTSILDNISVRAKIPIADVRAYNILHRQIVRAKDFSPQHTAQHSTLTL